MKKIILASVVASSLFASDSAYSSENGATYEVTPMIGYVNTKDHVDIKNHAVIGISASRILSNKSIFSSLEIGLLQSGNADYENNMGDTKITQIFYNALKDYKLNDSFKLYALAGLGYERIDTQELGNESDPFFNYGVGTAYTFENNFSLKLDVRHQLKFDGDKNIVTLLGLSIPFGSATQKVVDLDNDNDGIVNSLDKCPTTPIGTQVNETGCAIILDGDNDGVIDANDKCLTTAAGIKVDALGCEVLDAPADLGIVFDTNSDKINDSEIVKFDKYVKYLENVTTAKIILEAHTDSVGNENYNLQLSQRRAQSAKSQLISMGIESERITATGYGETKPLVENNSTENMKKNRRVTARITK